MFEMTPLEEAQATFRDLGQEDEFYRALDYYSTRQYFMSCPDFLLMAEPVARRGREICRATEPKDTWFVYFILTRKGDLVKTIQKHLPFFLEYCAFARPLRDGNFDLSFIPTEKILRWADQTSQLPQNKHK